MFRVIIKKGYEEFKFVFGTREETWTFAQYVLDNAEDEVEVIIEKSEKERK